MNKLLLFLLLLFVLPSSLAVDGDLVSFGSYYGQEKKAVLEVNAYLTGEGCFYNYVSAGVLAGGSYTNTNCNANDLGLSVSIKPSSLMYDYDYVDNSIDGSCSDDDFKTSCLFPYKFYTWLSDDDVFNVADINRYSSSELVALSDYSFYSFDENFDSGSYPTLALYDGIIYNDKIDSLGDLQALELVRSGYKKGSFGSALTCGGQLGVCLDNPSYCYVDTNNAVLNTDFCDSVPISNDLFDLSSDDPTNYYYKSSGLNYWLYPFRVRAIVVKTFTTDGNSYVSGVVDDLRGDQLAPLNLGSYVTSSGDYYDKVIGVASSPFDVDTGYDSVLRVPLDTNNYVVSDIDYVLLEIDFYINDDYRHKTPLDFTARFSDLFDSGLLDENDQGVRLVIRLDNIVSSPVAGDSDNDPFVNQSANFSASSSTINEDNSTYGDFAGGYSGNDEFNDEIELMNRQAIILYNEEQQKDFFAGMLDVAVLMFGVFLTFFSLITAVLFFGIIGLLFFGLYKSMFRAIDEVFKWW